MLSNLRVEDKFLNIKTMKTRILPSSSAILSLYKLLVVKILIWKFLVFNYSVQVLVFKS